MVYCIRDPRMRELVHSTAMDAVTDSFKIRLDRSKVALPKMKFKGRFHPTVVRKPLAAAAPNPATTSKVTKANSPGAKAVTTTVTEKKSDVITPECSIRYRSHADLQDHVIQSQGCVMLLRCITNFFCRKWLLLMSFFLDLSFHIK